MAFMISPQPTNAVNNPLEGATIRSNDTPSLPPLDPIVTEKINQVIEGILSGELGWNPSDFTATNKIAKDHRSALIDALVKAIPNLELPANQNSSAISAAETLITFLCTYAHKPRDTAPLVTPLVTTMLRAARLHALIDQSLPHLRSEISRLRGMQLACVNILKSLPEFSAMKFEAPSKLEFPQIDCFFMILVAKESQPEIKSLMTRWLGRHDQSQVLLAFPDYVEQICLGVADGHIDCEQLDMLTGDVRKLLGERLYCSLKDFADVPDQQDKDVLSRLAHGTLLFLPELLEPISRTLTDGRTRPHEHAVYRTIELLSKLSRPETLIQDSYVSGLAASGELIKTASPQQLEDLEQSLCSLLKRKAGKDDFDEEFKLGVAGLGGFAGSQSSLDFLHSLSRKQLPNDLCEAIQLSRSMIVERQAGRD